MIEWEGWGGGSYPSLPDRILDIVVVKSDEEAKNGEEHDGVGSEGQSARSAFNLQ